MKVAMVQMNVIAGDVAGNKDKGLTLISQAARKAEVVVLPEIWTIGYALKNVAQAAETMDGSLVTQMAAIARDNGVNIVAGSIPLKVDNHIYNSAIIIDRQGTVVASYDKVHLFSLYGEERFFAPGTRLGLFALGDLNAGVGICYDLRFPELFRSLALQGAQVVFVPAEWPAARGGHWRTLIQARAIENHIYVCAVNCVGEHRGGPFYGHSLLVGPEGEVVAEGSDQEAIIYGEIDLARVSEARKNMPTFTDRRPDIYWKGLNQ
ncbi:carbon-nitrogen family hydrolase [Sporomusa malonica]|uniref:Carbon-nitrogen hydrolase n=1 Tax=Sporomusa malonica TaxID=112901 RepID=A0A1W2EAH6_9FIRM|nr:carbon-nitrogen family hydrolase [Sporomusa malonica]SMD06655.1 Carbon-nitrogen hydrolase [Sporomusa malonica]